MLTISMFRGLRVFINWDDHNPPHFHVEYAGEEMLVRIDDAEPIEGDLPSRQKKLILGWAVLHRDELMENWALAAQQKELFPIEPLR
jgi:hypothetical protein